MKMKKTKIIVNNDVLNKVFQSSMLTNICIFLKRNAVNLADLFFYNDDINISKISKTIIIDELGRETIEFAKINKLYSFSFKVEGTINKMTVTLYIPHCPYPLSSVEFGAAMVCHGSARNTFSAMLPKLEKYLKSLPSKQK